ncbi:MAG: acyl carrier protein [Spirochaetia bacterium]|nr:acyl carrier protein [Spirochaetia bacterium]
MNNPRLTQKVKEVVANKLNLTYDEIDVKKDLRNDLGMDSLDIIEVVFDLQRELKIFIPDQKSEKWKTIQDIIETVNELN